MKVNRHPIKAGSVIIFNFDFKEMGSWTPQKMDKFFKSLIEDVKNSLPVDHVMVTSDKCLKSVDIFENEV
jgi:hypothetical protein